MNCYLICQCLHILIKIRSISKYGSRIIIIADKIIDHFLTIFGIVFIWHIEIGISKVCPYQIIWHVILFRNIADTLIPVRSGLTRCDRITFYKKSFIIGAICFHYTNSALGDCCNLISFLCNGRNNFTGFIQMCEIRIIRFCRITIVIIIIIKCQNIDILISRISGQIFLF